MNKFKLLLAAVFLPILLAAPAGVAFASPLDIVDSAPGSFWGKADASVNNSDANHIQFNAEQGVKFTHLTWLTWYVGMNWWEEIGTSTNSYWAYGVKNDTWIPHLTLGIEEENYVFSEPIVATNALVGYISCNLDWNLKKDH